jgi:hypothetical protein
MAVFTYLLACFLPAAMFALLAKVFHWCVTFDWPPAWYRRREPVLKPAPDHVKYCNDLRRLSATHKELQTAAVPARALRLRAVEMAYDDILRDACAAFELERPPEHLDPITRLQVEADLLTAGLRW